MYEQFMKRRESNLFIIRPSSMFKISWDTIILIILLYTAIYVPYRTAFYPNTANSSRVLLVFETIVDTSFIIDILITFFTPYARNDGVLEYRHKRIAINYLFGLFWLDLVVSFPTQIFEPETYD
jgi:hypothetical protein